MHTFDPIPVEQLRPHGYQSQLGQDLLVDQHILHSLEHGTYVDVGAHDGITYSNTWYLEHHRHWHGICIEPNPALHPALNANRPYSTNIQAAIADEPGTAPFRLITGTDVDMLSGIEAHYDPRHRARINAEIAAAGASCTTIDVPVVRLDDLLTEHGLTAVDFLSIDVEGAEVGVVRSIDLARWAVQVVVCENNYQSHTIPEAFEAQGYRLAWRIGWDDVYVPA